MNSLAQEWKSDRLKDVAAINVSALPASTDPDYEFDYLEISNVDYHGVVNPQAIERMRYEDAPSRARRRVAKNCTVISSVRPNLQAVAYLTDGREDFVCSTGFNVVKANEAKLSPRFTYFVLISEHARQYFEATAKGVGYPAVDDKDFDSFSVPLPPLLEQERIAAYLDASCAAIDAAIAAKRRQLETLDGVRETLIESAVTRGIKPQTRTRQVDEEWIGEIPAHWKICRIKRIVSQVDYGISEATVKEGQFPVLKMAHIQRGEVVFSNIDFVEDVAEALLLEKGDLLYNRTNSPDQVGKAAIFRGTKRDKLTFASYLVRLRTNHRADPYFLNYVLNSRGFLSFARKLAIPSVQQSNLNSTRYCRMWIPLPPLGEQREIAAFLDAKLEAMNRVVTVITSQIETLRGYRKSLIHECVTGQRRITEADIAAAQRTASM
ncbi:MAG: restriction endonuclease subunit S [Pyrinomonadaceae bacterium]